MGGASGRQTAAVLGQVGMADASCFRMAGSSGAFWSILHAPKSIRRTSEASGWPSSASDSPQEKRFPRFDVPVDDLHAVSCRKGFTGLVHVGHDIGEGQPLVGTE